MRRTDRERRRLAIASALRNAQRPLNLSDNVLIEEAAVRTRAAERYQASVMRDELALSDLVIESAKSVLAQLRHDARLTREATVLETVIADGSVQLAARRLARSREHISNTAWRTVTGWVLDEFERRSSVRRPSLRSSALALVRSGDVASQEQEARP